MTSTPTSANPPPIHVDADAIGDLALARDRNGVRLGTWVQLVDGRVRWAWLPAEMLIPPAATLLLSGTPA